MSNEHCIDESKTFEGQTLANSTPYKNVKGQGLNQSYTPYSQKNTLPNTLVKDYQFDQDINCEISSFDSDNADQSNKSQNQTLQFFTKPDQREEYSPNVDNFNVRNDSSDQEYTITHINVGSLVSDYNNMTQSTFAYPSLRNSIISANQSNLHQNSGFLENFNRGRQNQPQCSKSYYQQPIEPKVSMQDIQMIGIDGIIEKLKNFDQIVESVDNHNQILQTKIEPSYSFIGSKKRINSTLQLSSADNSCKNKTNDCNQIFEKPLSNTQSDVEIIHNQYPSNIGKKRTFLNITLKDSCIIEDHGNQSMFFCTQEGCSKSYSNKNSLDNHKRAKHGKPKYICTYEGCDKSYNDQQSFKQHRNSHEGIKDNKCKICEKRYTTQGHLKEHEKSIHEKIKNFACTYPDCNDRFARKSVLIVHMRKHNNDKPYKCDQCTKCFTESGNLKVHKQTHDKATQKLFRCKVENCQKSFLTKCQLSNHYLSKKHIESIHKVSQDDLKYLNITKDNIDESIRKFKIISIENSVSDLQQDQLSLQVNILIQKVSLENIKKLDKRQQKMQSKKQQNNEKLLKELEAIRPVKEDDIETQSNNNSSFDNEQFLKRLKLE